MNIIRRYLANDAEDEQVLGADIVDKLVDRFQSATRMEDRRDVLRTLKALSKRYRVEVGTKAMPVFMATLKTEADDTDAVCYCFESLYAIMNDEDADKTESQHLLNIPTDLGSQFTEIFIKDPPNVELILRFVDAYDLHIRRNAIRLLTVLLVNQLQATQAAILKCPLSISKLVDILPDPHEALRNEVLLLLLELTKYHMNIQKIVAFENAFEHLFSIATSEGLTSGSIVVEDCLRLLRQLLDGNVPNQILFRENNYVQRLGPFLDFGSTDTTSYQTSWSSQKITNIQLVIQVVRTIVSPQNKNQVTRLNQTTIYNCGLFGLLCDLVMANEVPAEVLATTVYAIADAIRGCPINQAYLTKVIAPSQPRPQPAVTILLVSMVNEKQALPIRVAALYCLQSYLMGNRSTQTAMVQSLLPSETISDSTSDDTVTTGEILCNGIFSAEPLSTWFSALTLMYCLEDNVHMRVELLRVQMASGKSRATIGLLQQCFRWFQESSRLQTRIALLQLLCVWLAYCPTAVRQFLQPPESIEVATVGHQQNTASHSSPGSNLSHLVAELAAIGSNDESEVLIRGLSTLLTCICVLFNPGDVSGFDRQSLMSTLERRIGIDMVMENLNRVYKSEAFTLACRHPEPHYRTPADLVFDYSFTRLFKRLEYEIMRLLHPDDSENGVGDVVLPPNSDTMLKSYKNKMVDQERELHVLRSRVGTLEAQLSKLHLQTTTQATTMPFSPTESRQSVPLELNTGAQAIKDISSNQLQSKLTSAEQKVASLEQRLATAETEKNTLDVEHEDLLILLNDQDEKITRLEQYIRSMGVQLDTESVGRTDVMHPANNTDTQRNSSDHQFVVKPG